MKNLKIFLAISLFLITNTVLAKGGGGGASIGNGPFCQKVVPTDGGNTVYVDYGPDMSFCCFTSDLERQIPCSSYKFIDADSGIQINPTDIYDIY